MIGQAPTVAKSQIVLPKALADKVNGYWILGEMETDFPPGNLDAYIVARMGETNPDPGAGNKKIIDSNEPWQVDVYWLIVGSLVPFLDGKYAVRLYLETLGKNNIDLEPDCDQGLIDFTPGATGFKLYHATFTFKGGEVKPEHLSTPYQPVVTVTSLTSFTRGSGLDPKDDRSYFTGPIIGFVTFPISVFSREDIEV